MYGGQESARQKACPRPVEAAAPETPIVGAGPATVARMRRDIDPWSDADPKSVGAVCLQSAHEHLGRSSYVLVPARRAVAVRTGPRWRAVRLGRLAGGMVYAVAIAQQGVRLALIGAALHKALRAGASAAVMTAQDSRQFLRKLALNGVDLAEFERAAC
ncbi:MAG: hypothetical protein QM674_14160 [Burkholderiaceae bacterium]